MAERITRRTFGGGMLAAGLVAASGRASLSSGANGRVRLGVIGLGNRGDQLIDAFKLQPDAEFTALCDVYEPYVRFAAAKVGGSPFLTGDYRRVLDRKDVDAVIIATPDHWHALQFIEACAAGKDVYVEKPLSLTVAEGRAMVDAAARYGRVSQVGTQRRSTPTCMKAAELIRSGAIGRVMAARCFHIRNESPVGIGSPPDSDPPPGLDWDMWLGPAPRVAYNENRCLYKYRWFPAYSGGQLANFGTHYVDVIQWAMGEQAPAAVVAMGGKYAVQDNREIPDTMQVTWEYPGGALVTFSQFNANAAPGNAMSASVEIRGTEGTAYLPGDRLEIVPEVVRVEPLPSTNPLDRKGNARQALATRPAGERFLMHGRVEEDPPHARNFLDCVKSRKPTNCPVEVGHRATTATLIGNIAWQRRKYLLWDAATERFTNDDEANALLSYEYRAPWRLPSSS